MRRLCVVATLAVWVLTGCSSGSKPEVPAVTIPVETTVATTIPPTSTEAATTVAESTTVATSASPEDELRAATEAYWAEFRRTLLNLQTDDLATLSAWYASSDYAEAATAELRQTKNRLSSYRDGNPPLFRVRVDDLRRKGAEWIVRACVADNLLEYTSSVTDESVLDNSTAVNIFTFSWIRVDDAWRVAEIVDREAVSDGSTCE